MIKEAIDRILELKKERRDLDVKIKYYGNYSECIKDAKFDERTGNYTVNCETLIKRSISTIKSLTSAILEEAKRRENKTGEYMTVLFNQKGGYFSMNDDFYSGNYTFERTLSQQWRVLSGIAGKVLDHESFLLALQELNPSIQNFPKLYRQFIKVRIIGRSELASNPVYVDGEAESGFMVKYTLESGQSDEEILPQGFICELPYSKGSEKKYIVPVETMILNNGSNQLVIRVNCPILEQVEEQAIFDEVEQLRKDTSELQDLLILESY